jgi:hypothetical protein
MDRSRRGPAGPALAGGAPVTGGLPAAVAGAPYYLFTAGGILAALGIVAATFPLLARITGPRSRETTRPVRTVSHFPSGRVGSSCG